MILVPFVVFAMGLVLFATLNIALMYNGLVKLRNMCNESWSNIDTELKRRYDLIPNLVETVKGYAAHESEVFRRVTELRQKAVQSTGSPRQQSADENALVLGLRSLLAVVENYPQLKASDHFLQLQKELARTENRIQAARRFYNGNVRDLNSKIQMFPSNVIASMFQFAEREFFEVEELARVTPPVTF